MKLLVCEKSVIRQQKDGIMKWNLNCKVESFKVEDFGLTPMYRKCRSNQEILDTENSFFIQWEKLYFNNKKYSIILISYLNRMIFCLLGVVFAERITLPICWKKDTS